MSEIIQPVKKIVDFKGKSIRDQEEKQKQEEAKKARRNKTDSIT
jgi:hypothetical protein